MEFVCERTIFWKNKHVYVQTTKHRLDNFGYCRLSFQQNRSMAHEEGGGAGERKGGMAGERQKWIADLETRP